MIHKIMKKTNVQDSKKVIKVGDLKPEVLKEKCRMFISVAITTGALHPEGISCLWPVFIIDDVKKNLLINYENIQ